MCLQGSSELGRHWVQRLVRISMLSASLELQLRLSNIQCQADYQAATALRKLVHNPLLWGRRAPDLRT